MLITQSHNRVLCCRTTLSCRQCPRTSYAHTSVVQGFKPQWTLIKERLRNVLTCYRPCSTGSRLARPQDISTVAKNLHRNIFSPVESHRYTYLLSDIGTMPCYKIYGNTVVLLHAIVGQNLEPTINNDGDECVRHVRWYIYLVAASWKSLTTRAKLEYNRKLGSW